MNKFIELFKNAFGLNCLRAIFDDDAHKIVSSSGESNLLKLNDSNFKILYISLVRQQSEPLIDFLLHLNHKGLINNHDFDYEEEASEYIEKLINGD